MGAARVVLWAAVLATPRAAPGSEYHLDPGHSHLGFSGRQSGAPFDGEFGIFTAHIAFDPGNLVSSRLEVTVDMRSVTTHEAQRDAMLTGTDFLAVARFQSAYFLAHSVSRNSDGTYSALGELQLRGVTREVPVTFAWRPTDGGALLEGGVALRRLDFGVGQGDWAEPTWVADEIQVTFRLRVQNAAGA